ncbi:hypothetical protein KP509_09G005200 [Ceratopteris richardii]|nr:hypothetical protein KP509_09G005200 [Ceratopteris richardii]KAH7428516.1 hypothetical protein KP509_09G005200 [Ceratopteris richardii]KAH7428518.1 hypothetical protein KP509_09G005200 [Ceratopteris richardii]
MFDGQVFRILSTVCPPSLRALRIININEGDIRRLFDLSFIPSTDHLTPDIHVTGYSSLQKISLVLDTITDTLMCVLTSTLVNLTELDLLDDPVVPPQADLSNWGIQQIANCQNLKVLSLIRGRSKSWGRGQSSSFRRVNDLGLLLMAESCKDLEIVRLGGFSQVTDTGLHCILENYPHLRVFELIGMKQTSDLTFHDMVATSCSLVVVSLPAANQITSDAVVQLASCSQLKLLNLAFCRSVGDRGLKALSYLSKLSLLDLSGADITDFGLISLSKSSMPLVSLSLRSCKRLTHNGITALTRGSLPYTLQELDFSNLPCITDLSVMAFIESGMQLIDLRLRDCYAISDECVAALASMNYAGKDHGGSLRVLDLSNNIGVSRKILNLFQKPCFARLEWLGLPKHLKSEVMATRLHDQRPRVHFSFTTNPDKEFSYDTLSSKHRDHWGVEIGVGLSFHQRCDLCALMQG